MRGRKDRMQNNQCERHERLINGLPTWLAANNASPNPPLELLRLVADRDVDVVVVA